LDILKTHSVRITNTSTRDSPRQRTIEDAKKALTSKVGKEDILPATIIRKRITIASLEEEIIQEQDSSKVEPQGDHSELSRSLSTLSPTSFPIKLHPQA
jgi:hypothetical protein